MPSEVRLFGDVAVSLEKRVDGTCLFRSDHPLTSYDRCVGDWLERWAVEQPDRTYLAERTEGAGAWRPLTFGQARARVLAIASWLLQSGAAADRPVVILSGNSVRHALLALAAMHIGVPVCPISTGWSLLADDHVKLRSALSLLDPGVVFAEDADRYSRAIEATQSAHASSVVTGSGSIGTSFAALEERSDEAAVMDALGRVDQDTVAKLLFTSGSVGAPKAVITTHRMLCSNMAAKAILWPFLEAEPPIFLDWLPWSHTFAGNQTMNMVLRFGGTMYLDTGRPTPDLFEETVANLRTVSPTVYSSVPRVYELLVPRLREDAGLRASFFERLRLIHYAGAALSDRLFADLSALARDSSRRHVPLVSSWGSTETAPMASDCHFEAGTTGNIGVPIPGTELKLLPMAGRHEVRVRGPNVTPGYWNAPDVSARAFDEEGFYLIGDTVAFVDPERPEAGLRFDGRIAEDFKLSTGTWVRVGALKARAMIALSPVASSVVVAGEERAYAGLLIFPDLDACRKLAGLEMDAPDARVLAHPTVRDHVQLAIGKLSSATGSSMFPARCLLMLEPPSREVGEITDKGYVNQRAVLDRRADLVEAMYAEEPSADVIVLGREEPRDQPTR